MSSLSSITLPKPKNWQDFERATRIVFACVLADTHTQQHGRGGQPQHGVDIFGYRNQDGGRLVGIQCKQKLDDAVTAQELEAELKKAKRFKPAITEFILVTTAPRDATIQRRALGLTQSLKRRKRPIRVAVWGWEDVEEHAAKYAEAIEAFDPTFNPYAKRADEKTQAKLDQVIAGQKWDSPDGRGLIDSKRRSLPHDPREIGPSDLLQAKYEVVPYVDVAGIKADLWAWCRDATRATAGRLIHGPGGMGKTRLLIETTAELRPDWTAGFLDGGSDQAEQTAARRRKALDELISRDDDKGLLIVVDYAEGRQDEIVWLAARLDARGGDATRPVRLVLLARSAGDWWSDLHDKNDAIARVFRRPVDAPPADTEALKRARREARFGDVSGLERIPEGEARVAFFLASVAGFEPVVRAMDWPHRTSAADDRRLRHYRDQPAFARPLALQMEALLHLAGAELDPDLVGIDALLERILTLERAHWTKLLGPLADVSETELRRGLSQVTGVGGVNDREAATGLLMRDRYYGRQVPAQTQTVLNRLSRIYGDSRGGIVPLEPDLLGEHEVATSANFGLAEDCLDWIATCALTEQSRMRQRMVTVLQRATLPEHGTACADKAAALLDHLIGHRMRDLAAAFVAVMIDTPGRLGELLDARINSLDHGALATLGAALPLQSLALMDFSLRLAEHRLSLARNLVSARDATEDGGENGKIDELWLLAYCLGNLGNRLSNLGRREEATAATQQAVDIYRRLAETRPDVFLPDLAGSLGNLGLGFANLGRREEALAATQQAVDITRRLAEARPDAILPDLARSLSNLGMMLSGLGRRNEALAASQEAVDIYRRLAETRPDVFLNDLARSLHNLGNQLSELGQREEALAASQQAVDIRKLLAESRPDAFLPDLAKSLNNVGSRLSDLGRREEALAASQQATDIYRRIAESRPDAFLPDLAKSLNNVSNQFFYLGRHAEALPPSQQAVDILRRFAETLPDAFLSDLAASLNNLGNRLTTLGRHKDALAASQEAVDIRRQLAETLPDVFLPDLSTSISTTSGILFSLDRHLDAASAAHRALQTLAPFVERYPGHHDQLARAVSDDLRRFSEAAKIEPDFALLERVSRALKPVG